MLIAGLTGSIATGKSTVSAILKDLGAFIIDADKIARDVVAPGMRAWDEIVRVFGKDVLQKTGEIDRENLARIVFNDAVMRGKLEEIIHPEVMRVIDEEIRSIKTHSSGAVVVLDVPLLIEVGMHERMDEVIVVYCSEDMQITRLMRRDNISREEALTKVRAQMPIEEKRRLATLLIDNSETVDETRKQVEEAYARLRTKAAKPKG
jgi:dephospho-CoA kinase